MITNNNETLGVWCQENNLSLNVSKTKEMIVDFRKQQREHPPIPYPHRRDSSVGKF